jgi:hypothetical protein
MNSSKLTPLLRRTTPAARPPILAARGSPYTGNYPDFQNAPPAKTKATIGPNRTASLFTVRILSPPPDSDPPEPYGLVQGDYGPPPSGGQGEDRPTATAVGLGLPHITDCLD